MAPVHPRTASASFRGWLGGPGEHRLAGMTTIAPSPMLAAIVRRYGDPSVVTVREVPRPTPRAGEVLVRVRAASVSSGDARVRALRVPGGMSLLMRLAMGVRGPRRPILGADFSGEVAALGAGVNGFAVGDAVAGISGMTLGAHAQYLCVRADRVQPKPASLSWEQAAALLFGGTTAMH